jgi:FMN phosphatase YigB (HAD superfamily)
MEYLIFDFDGVLGDTYESRIAVIQEMEGYSKEEAISSGDKYFTKSTHTRDLNLDEKTLKSMRDWNVRFGNLLHSKGFELFEGFIEELKKISNVKMAVVSSGSDVYIKSRLENCGVVFSPILSFEDHHSKEEKVEEICKDWKISIDEIYFFTDTISDVVELRNLLGKDKIFGCAWGYQGAEKLLTVLNRTNVLNNFSDIHKIFKSGF